MQFQQAFDPFRALSDSWRVLLRVPVALGLGALALFLLSDGDSTGQIEVVWDRRSWISWEDFPGFLLESVVGVFGLFFSVLFFLATCFLSTGLGTSLTRALRDGDGQVADLLETRGRFVRLLLALLLVGVILAGATLPLWIGGAIVYAVGSWFDAAWVTNLGMLALLVVWLPVFVYVFLGVRLTEYAVVYEDLEPIEAVKRSWALVDGNRLWLLFFLVITAVFAALGVLLCCVGVFVTGPLRVLAHHESYLRLVTPEDEQATWWITRDDDPAAAVGIDPPRPPATDAGADPPA